MIIQAVLCSDETGGHRIKLILFILEAASGKLLTFYSEEIMTNKAKTPRSVVLEMYELYQQRTPVNYISKWYGISRVGIYWLFERESLPLERKSWEQVVKE